MQCDGESTNELSREGEGGGGAGHGRAKEIEWAKSESTGERKRKNERDGRLRGIKISREREKASKREGKREKKERKREQKTIYTYYSNTWYGILNGSIHKAKSIWFVRSMHFCSISVWNIVSLWFLHCSYMTIRVRG